MYEPLRLVERAEARLAHHPLRPRHQPLGERGQQRADDHLDEPVVRLPAADDRGRPARVRDRALGRVHVDQPVEAVVDRQVGIDQALERVRARRERHREGRVDRRAALRVGAGRVEARAVRAQLDPRLQAHRLVGVAVVVDDALRLVDAVRQRGELGERAPLGVGEQLLHRRERASRGRAASASAWMRRTPVLFAATCARKSPAVSCFERICASTSRKTSSTIRPPRTSLTGGMITPSWNTSRNAPMRRGRAAADVDVVREVRDVAEQLALDVDRRDQAHVVQVHAARVRAVRQQHVAVGEVSAP